MPWQLSIPCRVCSVLLPPVDMQQMDGGWRCRRRAPQGLPSLLLRLAACSSFRALPHRAAFSTVAWNRAGGAWSLQLLELLLASA